MSTTFVKPELSITLNDLREAKKAGEIVQICILETSDGFYVHVEKHGEPTTLHYLSTRRDIDKPRRFRDLIRLNTLLRSISHSDVIKLKYAEKYKVKSKKTKILN